MNKSNVVKNMVDFIEEKEKRLQADRLAMDAQAKTDIVKSILEKLDKEIEDEDK